METRANRRRWCSSAALVAAGVVIATDAHAYSYQACSGNGYAIKWFSNASTTMYISTKSFPVGSPREVRLQNAMWRWNNVKGSRFTFYVGRDTDGSHSPWNGTNEVYFSSISSDALAVTRVRTHCYWALGWRFGIDETDIAFNSDYTWTTSAFDYASVDPVNGDREPYSFEGVALHELGHALGLTHEDRWQATMNTEYPTGGPFGSIRQWDPSGDDREGVRFLYRDNTTEVDIAGSALRGLIGSGDSALVVSPPSVARGGSLRMQFTFSNLSTSTQSFDVGFYLSTNQTITTADIWLGTNSGAWGAPGFTGTFFRGLTIPSWVAPGTYYLGFIVDPGNARRENNEGNNSQRMPRTVRVL